MAEQTPRSVLNYLIETCRDSERGYRAAASLVDAPTLKAKLLALADERSRFARELLPHAQRLGGDEASEGTRAAALHRGWMDLKAKMSPHNDQSILTEVVRGDEVTVRMYETALQEILPPTVVEVVEEQARKIRSAHAQVESLQPPSESNGWE
jgi:uncharacterized protein (TIGR02284 family)